MSHIFSSIPEAIEELKKGNMLVVVDSKSREDQGDVILPAETMTVDKANFLIKECRGLFCVPLSQKKAVEFDLPLMVSPLENTEKLKCNFTVTVDAKGVQSFGISAKDRALTVEKLVSKDAKSTDFVRPGHVFPIMAMDGGVLVRDGHTEATMDLITLAGFSPVGVLSEILADDGEPANLEQLIQFGKTHGLKIVSIEDLIGYRKKHNMQEMVSPAVSHTASSILPTAFGKFRIHIYKSIKDNREHVVLVRGSAKGETVPVRMHSQCITGDTFHSRKCDCQEQLHKSLEFIGKQKNGIVLYLNQEGRGIGLTNKIKAYALQEKGLDTAEANEALDLPIDARDFRVASEILKDLGVTTIELLTNNPDKVKQLETYGIRVSKRIPLEGTSNEINKEYLKIKKKKFGHLLDSV